MNIAENNRLLLDCYLSGRVPPHEWNEHLKDREFAKFVASEMGVAKPAPTLGARERAFETWQQKSLSRPNSDLDYAREVFKAGWNARKQLDYELVVGVKRSRPLHSSAYEPLTPFKPRQ
jgi:hypothetical protein